MSPSPHQKSAFVAQSPSSKPSPISTRPADTTGASHVSLDRQRSPVHPRLASLADAGLKAVEPSKNLMNINASARNDFPQLTGAAAMADEQRLKDEAERQRHSLQSANPALASLNALRGGPSQSISRNSDSSRLSPMAAMNTPPRPLTPVITDAMHVDQASPVSMSSDDVARNSSLDSKKRRAEAHEPSKLEDRSHKALTYPPPPPPPADNHTTTPVRGMSLPNAESRKSSTKKHRCPHCATEFTRHHNLKSHLLTHSQEKPYACQQCSAKFRRLHDLKRHTKLHTGERPHTCTKCGRKFARGDALARHSKGPGGCAGRRSSFDDDGLGDGGSGGEDCMEDVVTEEPDSQQKMQDAQRRRSEPGRNHNQSSQPRDKASPTPYRQHSSTYPGIAAMSGGARVPTSIPTQPNSKPPGLTYSPYQFTGPPAYSHGGMTESPRPLSPAQLESQRRSSIPDASHRDQVPGTQKSLQQVNQNRGLSQAATPVGLPPVGSQGPQLPPLSGIVLDSQRSGFSRNSLSSSMRPIPPPIVSPQPMPSQGPNSANSNTGSFTSSHHQSSGGSLREHLGPGNAGASGSQQEAALLDLISRMKADIEHMRSKYDTDVAKLREENDQLRAQLQRQHSETKS